jgi:hypothetical protein
MLASAIAEVAIAELLHSPSKYEAAAYVVWRSGSASRVYPSDKKASPLGCITGVYGTPSTADTVTFPVGVRNVSF